MKLARLVDSKCWRCPDSPRNEMPGSFFRVTRGSTVRWCSSDALLAIECRHAGIKPVERTRFADKAPASLATTANAPASSGIAARSKRQRREDWRTFPSVSTRWARSSVVASANKLTSLLRNMFVLAEKAHQPSSYRRLGRGASRECVCAKH